MSEYQLPLAFATGAVAYLLYFHRGEHHLMAVAYIQAFVSLSITAVIILNKLYGEELNVAIKTITFVGAAFLAGLYSTLLVWRAFFNPLNKFPGPFGARISSFWWSFRVGTSSHAFLKVQELHAQYGPYLRIGSNDMAIADPKAVNLIYGPNSKCRKSITYDIDKPMVSMHTDRSREAHDKRRRIWSPAFSDKALRDYEKRMEPYADALRDRIEASKGQPVDVSKWFNFFGYDVMGNLAFGKDFGMLQSGKEHFAINLLNEGMQPVAMHLPVWFFRMLAAIPGAAGSYFKFIKYCGDELNSRMKTKPEVTDIMTPLLDPYQKRAPRGLELSYLQGDSRLIIVAGSDTTSATLVYMFCHLARQPEIVEKAREEVKSFWNKDGTFNHREASHSDYINGIINESLRMHPPVPTAIVRMTPPEGLQIGDKFLPGNVNVWCPPYVLGRSEKAYVDPNSFIPERWSTKPELVKDKDAFFPFSLGPMGCIGKPLALMELRCVLAKLITAFDVEFAPGEDGTDLIQKSRDHFTIEPGPLRLVFKPRAGTP